MCRALSRLLCLGLALQILPALVSAGTGECREQEQVPCSDAVSQLIAREGARGALQHLTRDDVAWFEVLRQVSSGSPAWIRIAAQLTPAADGGPGEELVISIQDALPTRAALILSIVEQGGSFTAAEVCGNYGSGQIEDERPKSTILALIRTRQDAVQAVSDPGLAVAKNACLTELMRLERSVRAKTPLPPRSLD